jgi:hypothetical protein
MQTRPHAILTASDANCGDFLARHWLRSLRCNVDTREIDVIVLDFGLEPRQKAELPGVEVVPVEPAKRVNVARRRAIARLLESRDYDQVLVVDAGDLVFQGDVSPLFTADRDRFRGVPERYPIPLAPFLRGAPPDLRRRLRARLRDHPMVNGGFLLAPAAEWIALGKATLPFASDVAHDQPLVSLVLHERGFVPLADTWNFVLWTARERFTIEDGRFRGGDGATLQVVHNTGLRAPFRVIADFGYGPGYNTRVRKRYLRLARAWAALARAARSARSV